MPKASFTQSDIRRAVKAALDGGYPIQAIEIQLPTGVVLRLLPEAANADLSGPTPESW